MTVPLRLSAREAACLERPGVCPYSGTMHEVQALYLRHLAAAAETREVDGALAVRTGILSNTENGVVSTTAELGPGTVDALIEFLADVPASWIALEPALGPSLAAAGATPENDAWLLRGAVGEPAEPRHDVREVRTPEELDEWLDVLRDCGWWDDVEPARRLYQRLGTDGLYLTEDGAASAFFAPPLAYLNTVAVRERRRRRGIGTALAHARLREARARGCTEAVLAASPDGSKLWRALGFRAEPQPPGYWYYLPNQCSS